MQFVPYQKTEKAAIKRLFEKAFTESEGPEEGAMVAKLVDDMMNTTSDRDIFGFAATDNDRLVGGLFFTRLRFDNTPVEAFILSPVAVHPQFQGRGIGQQLINFGIDVLKTYGVQLVFTYGDPGFYAKAGFQPITERIIQAPHTLRKPQGWLCQSLEQADIAPIPDIPRCVDALDKPDYW